MKKLFLFCAVVLAASSAKAAVKIAVTIGDGTAQAGSTNPFHTYTGTIDTFTAVTGTFSVVNTSTANVASINTVGIGGMKNLAMNGDFAIDQRNEGASVALVTGANIYGPDMYFSTNRNYPGKWSAQRLTTTPPAPMKYYWHIAITSATLYQASSETASSEYVLSSRINGLDVQDNGFGTAYARNLSASFWVRSSSAGVYGFGIESAASDSYASSFSVTAANTWYKVCLNIPGDTAGTWTTSSGIGFKMIWNLGSGSDFQASANTWSVASEKNHYAGNNVLPKILSATFDLAAVQLEYGNTCTVFEKHPYDYEKKRLERYYEKSYADGIVPGTNTGNGSGSNAQEFTGAQLAATETNCYLRYKTSKHTATPTVTFYTPAGNSGKMNCFTTGGVGTERTVSQEVLGSEGVGFYETTAVENFCQGHYTAESPL